MARREDGVFRSVDGGETWQSINRALLFLDDWRAMSKSGERTAHQLERGSQVALSLQISPAFPQDRTLFLASAAGLYRSEDAGDSWHSLTAFSDRTWVLSTVLSPGFETDHTLYAVIKGRGVFKSTDRGQTFTEVWRELIERGHLVKKIVILGHPEGEPMIYAASDKLFASTDGGASWRLVERPLRLENERPPLRIAANGRLRDPMITAPKVR